MFFKKLMKYSFPAKQALPFNYSMWHSLYYCYFSPFFIQSYFAVEKFQPVF